MKKLFYLNNNEKKEEFKIYEEYRREQEKIIGEQIFPNEFKNGKLNIIVNTPTLQSLDIYSGDRFVNLEITLNHDLALYNIYKKFKERNKKLIELECKRLNKKINNFENFYKEYVDTTFGSHFINNTILSNDEVKQILFGLYNLLKYNDTTILDNKYKILEEADEFLDFICIDKNLPEGKYFLYYFLGEEEKAKNNFFYEMKSPKLIKDLFSSNGGNLKQNYICLFSFVVDSINALKKELDFNKELYKKIAGSSERDVSIVFDRQSLEQKIRKDKKNIDKILMTKKSYIKDKDDHITYYMKGESATCLYNTVIGILKNKYGLTLKYIENINVEIDVTFLNY